MCKSGDTVEVRVWVPPDLAHEGVGTWKVKPVDRCIAGIVQALVEGGVLTRGSCCGHGRGPGSIILEDGRELVIENGEQERHLHAH